MSETRSHEHTITIDAPIDAVWKTLTDAAEIVRWYVKDAKIDPRVGGTYWVSWGPGLDGESVIEAFDEPSYFRIAYKQPEKTEEAEAIGCQMPDMPEPIIEEYHLTTDGSTTTLRLVHSRIPCTPEWDQFYDGTNVGWEGYFHAFKHCIERHPGKARGCVELMLPTGCPADEAWSRLMTGFGLEGASEGDFEATNALGDTLSGTITTLAPGSLLQAQVDSLDAALFGLNVASAGDTGYFCLSLMTWGLPEEQVEDIRTRWTAWLSELLESPQPAAQG